MVLVPTLVQALMMVGWLLPCDGLALVYFPSASGTDTPTMNRKAGMTISARQKPFHGEWSRWLRGEESVGRLINQSIEKPVHPSIHPSIDMYRGILSFP